MNHRCDVTDLHRSVCRERGDITCFGQVAVLAGSIVLTRLHSTFGWLMPSFVVAVIANSRVAIQRLRQRTSSA
jgi:hypothetical protein